LGIGTLLPRQVSIASRQPACLLHEPFRVPAISTFARDGSLAKVSTRRFAPRSRLALSKSDVSRSRRSPQGGCCTPVVQHPGQRASVAGGGRQATAKGEIMPRTRAAQKGAARGRRSRATWRRFTLRPRPRGRREQSVTVVSDDEPPAPYRPEPAASRLAARGPYAPGRCRTAPRDTGTARCPGRTGRARSGPG